MSDADGFPQYRRDIQYSDDSIANTLELCIPRPTTHDPKQVWVVFIHGGAWRDPEIDSSSFRKAQELLLRSPVAESIAGLASINYRLSPYPSHPQSPSNPSDPARNARHPDHINDILAALLHLQETFRFDDRYVLVGHSCGATLALQVAMKRYWGAQYESTFALELNVVPPVAILGVEGVYDLPALVSDHSDQLIYRDFVKNAFGSDEATWAAASPARYVDFEDSWPDGRLVVLAHSLEDELVEFEQPDLQRHLLERQGWSTEPGDRQLRVVDLHGTHDGVWQDGTELARAIETTVQSVQTML
ncbi:hypothetical protein BAUCODRAFT_29193 [Baudoinia panamericana UAMH 10762]|uniref:Kynurenine formamidase n=1 Tax=Baudoinia panamericana (strain UAMH 10762) TaxID=717646 RepID=M2M190_BAUPA|nr:uncharacterized protein BAUCODRAFT_29193 [Baudoinia panamericana UAMH 10762]EMD00813.1 hypothetical protein BAUCODRAFT_29193 [Baudoinia panamericana UAMH 10762]